MRLIGIFSFAAVLTMVAGCQTGPSETDRQVVKQLKEISEKLTAIDKQVKEIKENVPEPLPSLPRTGPFQASHGPDIRRLTKIKLPENAKRQDVRTYIQKIIAVSQGQNVYSSNDPQVFMLRKVGPENVDLLLQYLPNYYVQYVLPELVGEKNKKQILEALKVYPQLIGCVVRANWIKDARDTIFERLKHPGDNYLPSEWIDSAVTLATPRDYGTLKNYFVTGNNPEMTYRALSRLDKFDMKDAVTAAWNYQKSGSRMWATRQMAMIAAEYGHKDALKYLVTACPVEPDQYFTGRIQQLLFRLTGQSMSLRRMQRWYQENEANLVFNPESGKYEIKAKKK